MTAKISYVKVNKSELITRTKVTGNKYLNRYYDKKDVIEKLSSKQTVDMGLIPPVLQGYWKSGLNEQYLVVLPPNVNTVKWGVYEKDSNVEIMQLAQPFRVSITHIDNGNFVGMRMFYSPYPITSLDQQLYHTNLPNTNCRGYGDYLAVGWVCIYHNESWFNKSCAEKVSTIISHMNGSEAFNDQNMSETDGTRFYESLKPNQTFLWDKNEWESKSLKEGWEWTLDPDLWIPVKTSDEYQSYHDEEGKILTLKAALEGEVSMYYDIEPTVSPARMKLGSFETDYYHSDFDEYMFGAVSNLKPTATTVK